jgi:hypothetical protein
VGAGGGARKAPGDPFEPWPALAGPIFGADQGGRKVAMASSPAGAARGRLGERGTELLRALARTVRRPAAGAAPVAPFCDPPWTVPFLRRDEVAVRSSGG